MAKIAKTEKIDFINQYVSENWEVGAFLEDIIFRLKVRFKRHQASSGKCGVYRIFATIISPVVTNESYDHVFYDVMKSRRFADIAKKLKVMAARCNSADKETDVLDLVMYMNHINGYLTSMVNRFLRNNLSLRVSIDSFVSDIEDLRMYLKDHVDISYATAYDHFEKEVLTESIESPVDDDMMDDVKSSFLDQEDTFSVSFLPVNYSVTYVDILASELAIELDDEYETVQIEETINPLLYKLASSTFEQLKAYPYHCSRHLLVTRDDHLYEIYKGVFANETYLISR
jgi:hypothetical protein